MLLFCYVVTQIKEASAGLQTVSSSDSTNMAVAHAVNLARQGAGTTLPAQAQQMQMIGKVMPIFFGFISWTLPTGLVVYFLTGNIFRIGQQALIVKLDDREETKKENTKNEENEQQNDSPVQENSRKNRKKRRRK